MLPLTAVPKFYNLGNKDTKSNLVTSHFWQLPKISHNSRVTVKFLERSSSQSNSLSQKGCRNGRGGAEGGGPE